jgi:hypothetical protein
MVGMYYRRDAKLIRQYILLAYREHKKQRRKEKEKNKHVQYMFRQQKTHIYTPDKYSSSPDSTTARKGKDI